MLERLMQLARHSAVYGIGSIASKVVAIVLLPLYVRFLDPVHYGAVETILVVDLLLAAFVKLGLQNSLMRFYYDEEAEDPGRGRLVAAAVFWITGGLALVVGGAVAVAAEPLASALFGAAAPQLHNDGTTLVLLGTAHLLTTVVYASVIATFRLQHRPAAFAVASVTNVLLTGGFTVLFLVGFGWNAEGLLLGNTLGTLVMLPILCVLQRRFLVPRFESGLIREMLGYGVPLMPMGLAMQGLRVVDRLLLQSRSIPASTGLTAVGLYSVGARFSQVVILVVTALQLSWQPFAYAIRDDEEARRTYAAVMTAYIGLVGWIVASVAMLADPLVRILTTPAYYDAADAVPLLTLGAMFFGAYFIAAIGVGRAKKTRLNVLIAAAAFAVSFALNWVLIPHLGIIGAGLAAVGANLTLAVGMVIRSQQVFPIPYQYRRVAVALAATCVWVAASYAVPRGTLGGAAIGVGAAAVFPVVLLTLGYARPSEARQMLRLLLGRRGTPPTEDDIA